MAKVSKIFLLSVEKMKSMSIDAKMALSLRNVRTQLIQKLEEKGFIVMFSRRGSCGLPAVVVISLEVNKEGFILQQAEPLIEFFEVAEELGIDLWFESLELVYDKEALKLVDELGLSSP